MEPQIVKRNAFSCVVSNSRKISSRTSISRVGSLDFSGYLADYQPHRFNSGTMAIESEKFALQQLNNRLASYMETVRSLEKANSKLEFQIREATEKRGPLEGKEYSKYHTIIADLRAKVRR